MSGDYKSSTLHLSQFLNGLTVEEQGIIGLCSSDQPAHSIDLGHGQNYAG